MQFYIKNSRWTCSTSSCIAHTTLSHGYGSTLLTLDPLDLDPPCTVLINQIWIHLVNFGSQDLDPSYSFDPQDILYLQFTLQNRSGWSWYPRNTCARHFTVYSYKTAKNWTEHIFCSRITCFAIVVIFLFIWRHTHINTCTYIYLCCIWTKNWFHVCLCM